MDTYKKNSLNLESGSKNSDTSGQKKKPLKIWIIPLASILIGLLIGYSTFPSKEDYIYKQWLDIISSNKGVGHNTKTEYIRDSKLSYKTEGSWHSTLAVNEVITPVSDGTEFSFTLYTGGDTFIFMMGLNGSMEKYRTAYFPKFNH